MHTPAICPPRCPNLVVVDGWHECGAYRKQLIVTADGEHARLAECVAEERADDEATGRKARGAEDKAS